VANGGATSWYYSLISFNGISNFTNNYAVRGGGAIFT